MHIDVSIMSERIADERGKIRSVPHFVSHRTQNTFQTSKSRSDLLFEV
jgi:hypothetical protein